MKKVLSVSFCVFLTLLAFCSSAMAVSAANYEMDTKAFDVDIKVREDNVYDITTTIKVYFNVQKHGIYYYVPYAGEVARRIDGEDVRTPYRNRISNISIPGYNYAVSNENENVLFKIGDAETYVSGEKTYVIKYRCRVADDKTTALDDVYWNIFPPEWESPIQAATVTFTMPKEFDPSKLEFIGGAYGSTDTDLMTYNVDGNTITAMLKQPLPKGDGVSMRLVLPNGYFVENNKIFILVALVMLAAFGLIVLLWVFYGRDEKIIPVVSFTPPKGMTSAETGYIIDGVIDDKDLISLLLF